MKKSLRIILLVILVILLIGLPLLWKNISQTSQTSENKTSSKDTSIYNYINKDGKTLESRINTPEGFTRISSDKNSMGEFLRQYPLKKDGSPVLLYNGKEKANQSAHAAVFDMYLGDRNLQQCADSVIRVYAEYFYEQKQFDKIKFHFVDGFLCDYEKWRNGYRVKTNGNSSSWVKTSKFNDSKESFESYLNMVFAYASTLSLEEESKKIKPDEMQIGDIFITGGSPGHVVIVVDMCENDKGEKGFLLAQGYMPAQEFHILKSNRGDNNPWYYVSDIKYPFKTPGYTFEKECFRRLDY